MPVTRGRSGRLRLAATATAGDWSARTGWMGRDLPWTGLRGARAGGRAVRATGAVDRAEVLSWSVDGAGGSVRPTLHRYFTRTGIFARMPKFSTARDASRFDAPCNREDST